MTLQEIVDRLAPLGEFESRAYMPAPSGIESGIPRANWYAAHKHEATDVLLTHRGWSVAGSDDDGWSFADLVAVSSALGITDIDIASVASGDEALRMERRYGGCDTCGCGDALLLRGVLTPLLDVASPDVLRIIQWLRSLPAPSYSYGIPYEGLAACIESGLDPTSPAMQEYAEE